jgi:hypothetical protein
MRRINQLPFSLTDGKSSIIPRLHIISCISGDYAPVAASHMALMFSGGMSGKTFS